MAATGRDKLRQMTGFESSIHSIHGDRVGDKQMSTIPGIELQGHQKLLERAEAAIERRIEGKEVDFKRSEPWDSLKNRIVVTAIAMANLRDGGLIVVGMDEDKKNQTWNVTGVDPVVFSTYNPDHINQHLANHTSPSVRVELVRYNRADLCPHPFLVFHILEFDTIPVLLTKALSGEKFQQGDIIIRSGHPVSSRRPMTAMEMHDLVELAADKNYRAFIERAHRLGLQPRQTDQERFDAELQGL